MPVRESFESLIRVEGESGKIIENSTLRLIYRACHRTLWAVAAKQDYVDGIRIRCPIDTPGQHLQWRCDVKRQPLRFAETNRNYDQNYSEEQMCVEAFEMRGGWDEQWEKRYNGAQEQQMHIRCWSPYSSVTCGNNRIMIHPFHFSFQCLHCRKCLLKCRGHQGVMQGVGVKENEIKMANSREIRILASAIGSEHSSNSFPCSQSLSASLACFLYSLLLLLLPCSPFSSIGRIRPLSHILGDGGFA